MAEKQVGHITSEPSDANVYFSEPATGHTKPIGRTPADGEIHQGLFPVYLVAEKDGYETDRILVPRNGPIDHHFVLERSFAVRIAEEAPKLPKEFRKGAARALSTFDRALHSPRMNAASVVAEAKAQVQDLIIDFPDQGTSATLAALRQLSSAATEATSIDSSLYDTPVEQQAVTSFSNWLTKIRIGLGLEL
jgi:hypothetical protein